MSRSPFEAEFLKELENGEYSWRIVGVSSTPDIIYAELVKFRLNPTEQNGKRLFNWCMKALILKELDFVKFNSSGMGETIQKIEKEIPGILNLYESIFQQISLKLKTSESLYELETYLKTLIDLDIKDFPDMQIRSIAKIILEG